MVSSLQSTFPTQLPMNFSHLSSMHRATVISAGHSMRMNAHASHSLFDQIRGIPQAIGTFCVHRYADFRMFVRSCISMSGSTQEIIDHRIRLTAMIREVVKDHNTAREALLPLSDHERPLVRDLFFYVDESYLYELMRETDPEKIALIQEEIVRECDRVICLQTTLFTVYSIFQSFFPCCFGEPNSSPERFDFSTVVEEGPQVRERPRREGDRVAPLARNPLDVPGTVPYVQNQIPQHIQDKAAEIAHLTAVYEARPASSRTPLPDHFNCIVMMSIMEIPVFDASHPGVESRVNRHFMEKDSMEHLLAANTNSGKCPMCRHPEHYGMRRGNLRIDTALQDEILQFLRTHARA